MHTRINFFLTNLSVVILFFFFLSGHVCCEDKHKPSANGTTIKALSTKTVFVRCCETPTDSDSRNFTKQTREVTGKGESLEENIKAFAKRTYNVQTHLLPSSHLKSCTFRIVYIPSNSQTLHAYTSYLNCSAAGCFCTGGNDKRKEYKLAKLLLEIILIIRAGF